MRNQQQFVELIVTDDAFTAQQIPQVLVVFSACGADNGAVDEVDGYHIFIVDDAQHSRLFVV